MLNRLMRWVGLRGRRIRITLGRSGCGHMIGDRFELVSFASNSHTIQCVVVDLIGNSEIEVEDITALGYTVRKNALPVIIGIALALALAWVIM